MSAPPAASASGAQFYGAVHAVDASHRLIGAHYRESPHQDERPDARDISLLVIHAISLPPGEFGRPADAAAAHRDTLIHDPANIRADSAPAAEAPSTMSTDDPANIGAARAHNAETNRTSYIDDLFLGQLDPAAHPYFETLRGLRVSAHLCIFRDGTVTQYVPFHRRAWHAGVSQFDGRERCNDYSIGIELEGCDEQPFSDAQYRALAAVTQALLQRYPAITPPRITGHSDIAPHRKTDPGPHFDWPRFRQSLAPAAG
jgi:AmpD protein